MEQGEHSTKRAVKVASRYLQSTPQVGGQQLDSSQTSSRPSITRQGYSARTTGKWGSSHYSATHTPASQTASSLHLVDISAPSPSGKKQPSEPKASRKYVPATPAVHEVPDSSSKWALRRPSAHDSSNGAHMTRNAAESDEQETCSTAMDIDEHAPSSERSQHDGSINTDTSNHNMNSSAAQNELDKQQERLRLLEEYRQKKQAQKLLQTQKKTGTPLLNGRHDVSSRRESLRGPRIGRPSSPGRRRMTISHPPHKYSTEEEDKLLSENGTPAVNPQLHPSSAPSASQPDLPTTNEREIAQSQLTHNSHAVRHPSTSHVASTSAPSQLGPQLNPYLRDSMSSTGSGTHQRTHVNEKPLSEGERAENFKRQRRSMQKWELQFRHLNHRAMNAMRQRHEKAESEIHAMLVLTDQHQDEAAALERQAARQQREKLLDDSLQMQLPLLEQHQQQQAHSTLVLHALHQSLLAALIHVPLINGACVGSNPSMPDLTALQHVLRKGVTMMKDLQPALDRLLTEPLQVSLPSTENAGDAQGDEVASSLSASGKGGVELAAHVAKDLSLTMTQEVQELQDCVELLRQLRAKENHNASYRVQLIQMKQAALL